MKKPRNSIILLSILGILGMASWSYLNPTSESQEMVYPKKSTDIVKKVNDGVYQLIKDDPMTIYSVNKIIESSAFLTSQKNAFMKKYNIKSSVATQFNNETMLRFYLASQKEKK